MSVKTALVKKHYGLPTWGWGLGLGALLYWYMNRK